MNMLVSDFYKALLFLFFLNGARYHLWRILEYTIIQWVRIRAFWIFSIQRKDLDLVLIQGLSQGPSLFPNLVT